MQTFAMKHMAQYPVRPQATPEILFRAGRELEAELRSWGHWQDLARGVAPALSQIANAQEMNGYELAKHLESTGALYKPDAQAVEVLDTFGYEVELITAELAEQWVREYQIQPPHPVGTLLREGVIVGIADDAPATYLVDIGRGDAQLLIPYEEAVTVKELLESCELAMA